LNPVALVAACFLLAAPARPGPAGTAMERLAALVAHQILEQKAESPVGIYVRGESAELSRAFATLLSAELARQNLPPVAVEALGPVDAEKTARSAGTRSLARLTLTLEGGTLAARGDLLGTWVNFWSGGTATRPPSPAAALSAQTEADARRSRWRPCRLPDRRCHSTRRRRSSSFWARCSPSSPLRARPWPLATWTAMGERRLPS
jgi:hypothetical protein